MIFILFFDFLIFSGYGDGRDREWTEMGRQCSTESMTLIGWKLLTVRSSLIRNKTVLIVDDRTDISKNLDTIFISSKNVLGKISVIWTCVSNAAALCFACTVLCFAQNCSLNKTVFLRFM